MHDPLSLIEVGRQLERADRENAENRATLARIEIKIDSLIAQGVQTMADLSALNSAVDSVEATVAANTDVVASGSALLDEIAQLIRDNAADQEALNALADRISSTAGGVDANTATLAEAIVRNTDVDPTPPA